MILLLDEKGKAHRYHEPIPDFHVHADKCVRCALDRYFPESHFSKLRNKYQKTFALNCTCENKCSE